MVDLAADFVDLLRCLSDHQVRYVVVGGYALNVHGVSRATEDLDVFVEPTDVNLTHLLAALDDFGMPPGLTKEALLPQDPPPSGFRFGRRPISVDILTSVVGLDFDTAWKDQVEVSIDGLPVRFLGVDALRQNKRAAGRLKDLADLEALDRASGSD